MRYISFIFIKKIRVHLLRSIIRGALKINKTKGRSFTTVLIDKLNNLDISNKNNFVNKVYFHKVNSISNTIINQYLSEVLLGLMFKRVLFFCAEKKVNFIYPLPTLWIQTINNEGIKCNKFLCILLFYLISFFFFIVGFFYLQILLLRMLTNFFFKNSNLKYLFILNLNDNKQFPLSRNKKTYNIFEWIHQNLDKDYEVTLHDYKKVPKKIDSNYDNKIIYNNNLFYNRIEIFSLFKFFYYYFKILFLSLYFIFTLNFYNLFLMKEISQYYCIASLKSHNIANKYIFIANKWKYRPIWTYAAEEHSSKIILLFYSVGSPLFEDFTNDGWYNSSWTNFYVFNEFQKNHLKKNIKRTNLKFYVFDAIYLSDQNTHIPKVNKKNLIIFDNTPLRYYFDTILNFPIDYINNKNINSFLDDIMHCALKYNITIYLKSKRAFNKKYHHLGYLNKIKRLKDSNLITQINSDVSAIKVIEKFDNIISFPFTSPSIIAKKMGKKSIYYDPTSTLIGTSSKTHSVNLISNKNDLEDWIISLY